MSNMLSLGKSLPLVFLRAAWTLSVLTWPLVKWILSVHVFFQLVRMVIHWDNPATSATFDFVVSFIGLTAMTFFVTHYKPPGR